MFPAVRSPGWDCPEIWDRHKWLLRGELAAGGMAIRRPGDPARFGQRKWLCHNTLCLVPHFFLVRGKQSPGVFLRNLLSHHAFASTPLPATFLAPRHRTQFVPFRSPPSASARRAGDVSSSARLPETIPSARRRANRSRAALPRAAPPGHRLRYRAAGRISTRLSGHALGPLPHRRAAVMLLSARRQDLCGNSLAVFPFASSPNKQCN